MDTHTTSSTSQHPQANLNQIIQIKNNSSNRPISLISDPSIAENLTKLTLIGKLISAKEVNYNKVIGIIQKTWKDTNGLSIASLGHNTFLFKFTSEQDVVHILSAGPWNIDGKHLMLRHWSLGSLPHELDFSTTTFWV